VLQATSVRRIKAIPIKIMFRIYPTPVGKSVTALTDSRIRTDHP